MRRLIWFIAVITACAFAGIATATTLPAHTFCQLNTGGNGGECGTIGPGTPYSGGFVFKGFQNCGGGVACPSLPAGTSFEITLVLNSTPSLSAGLASGEHTNVAFSLDNGAHAWIQAGIQLGVGCDGVQRNFPVLYVEANDNGTGSCAGDQWIAVEAASIGAGYHVKIVNNGGNNWSVIADGYTLNHTFSSPLVHIDEYNEDWDHDNVADPHDATGVDLIQNGQSRNWSYYYWDPGPSSNAPSASNPFEIDCQIFGSYFCASGRFFLPSMSPSSLGKWIEHTPTPITKDAPWITPGYYQNGKLVKTLPFTEWNN